MLARAAREQSLLDAWTSVRSAALEDGVAGPEVERFERDAARQIARISQELVSGEWHPSPVHHVELPKRDGGRRVLGIPTVEDRIVERALLAELGPVVDARLLPWSFAYRRGLSADDAVRALTDARDVGSGWVARGDVDDCFPSIPRWAVLEDLGRSVDEQAVLDLIRRLIDRPVVGKGAPKGKRHRGLHQSSPLSPVLANLFLDRFDRAMLARGWQVIRYSDDFAIPCGSRADGEHALQAAHDVLTEMRMRLGDEDSLVASFEMGVPFLGRTILDQSGAAQEPSSHPLETTVFVDRQGSLVRTRGDRLVVTDGQEVLLRLSLKRVRQVVLVGRVGMSTPFLHRALHLGIDIVLLNATGGFVGRAAGAPPRKARTVAAQVHRTAKESDRLQISRSMVRAKIGNTRTVALRLSQRLEGADARSLVDQLETLSSQAFQASSETSLSGIEGAAARAWFQWLANKLPEQWDFRGRQRRPPRDALNSLISFASVLLTNEAIAACEAAGLDPSIGVMHTPKVGRPSLALDLIEEWRPFVVDAVALNLLLGGRLSPTEFSQDPELGCRMSDHAKSLLLAAYETRMLRLVTAGEGRRTSTRIALHLQAKHLARCFENGDTYAPRIIR